MAVVMTRKLAYAIGTDAGNNSARKAGRTAWSAEDFEAATAALTRALVMLDTPIYPGANALIGRARNLPGIKNTRGPIEHAPYMGDECECPSCSGRGSYLSEAQK